jgi:Transglycosylase SLT domain
MNVDPTASRLAASGVAFASAIAGAARRHGLDPDLLAAVAAQETGGPDSNTGHNVVGDGGHGHGVFQIDDRWHAFAQRPEAMDPQRNADYAAGMLAGLLKRYGGDVHAALSAYNAGSPNAAGTTTRWSDGQTLSYADSVLRHYARIDEGDSAHGSAIEERATTIASVAMLAQQAQQLPMPAPPVAPPSVAPPHHSHAAPYHRQATDYLALFNDATDEKDS